jgi:hypothetical protein
MSARELPGILLAPTIPHIIQAKIQLIFKIKTMHLNYFKKKLENDLMHT